MTDATVNMIDQTSAMRLYSTLSPPSTCAASTKYASVTMPVVAIPTARILAPRPYDERGAPAPTLAAMAYSLTSSMVHGNGERACTTSPCCDSSFTKLRLDQWFRCPGVLPSSLM